jgi:hypothetical protein
MRPWVQTPLPHKKIKTQSLYDGWLCMGAGKLSAAPSITEEWWAWSQLFSFLFLKSFHTILVREGFQECFLVFPRPPPPPCCLLFCVLAVVGFELRDSQLLGRWSTRGRDQEYHNSKPAQANSSGDPVKKKGWQSGSSGRAPALASVRSWVLTVLPKKKKKRSDHMFL